MSELKPCPFCNGENLNLGYFIDDSSVHCASCRKLVILPISRNNTTEAIEQWNHRPFEAHAVEVLSQVIWNDYTFYRCTLEESKVKARELLGIKE